MEVRPGFVLDDRDGEINFIFSEHALQLDLVAEAQAQFEAGEFLAQLLGQIRDVLAQDYGGSADAQAVPMAALQLGFNRIKIRKERLDEIEESMALSCK